MKKHRAELMDAMTKDNLMVVCRKKIDDNRLEGYVVGLSDSWVLLHIIDGSVLTLNGYQAVRLKDISHLKVDEGFVDGYLRLRGLHPKTLPAIDVRNLPSLLRSVSNTFPLFMVERERVEPGIGLIGFLEKVTKGDLWLKKISSKARWIDTEKFSLKDITAVSFGDGYTEALALMDAHYKETAVNT